MEVVLIWLLFGIVAAVIASSKGRAGCGWFLLGIFFGPFSLVVALLPNRDSKQQQEARRYGASGDYRKCPYCAEAIRREAVKCRYCQGDLSTTHVDYRGDLSRTHVELPPRAKKWLAIVLGGLIVVYISSAIIADIRSRKDQSNSPESPSYPVATPTTLPTATAPTTPASLAPVISQRHDHESEPPTPSRELKEPLRDTREYQRFLRDWGFDPGPIDGVVGPQTRQALRRFQEAYSLAVTEQFDQPTIDKLQSPAPKFTPQQACQFLAHIPDMDAGLYHLSALGDYICLTPYKEIRSGQGRELPNNIAYYVTGTRTQIQELKLVLNINTRKQTDSAHQILAQYADELIQKVLSVHIPKPAHQAIISGISEQWIIGAYRLKLVREDWRTGKGYELKFIITERG